MDGRRGRAALAHPVFWLALIVLVVNDHLLKGAGVLPGALTGKVSDFAGLIVAPVFVAALFRARTRGGIVAAFAVATIPFIAINLSPAVARAVEAAVGLFGVPWQITCDPTDLVGLTMLPIAFHLVNRAGVDGASAPTSSALHKTTERALLVAAGFACMATSNPPPADPTFQTDLFVVNTTDTSVDLRVRWVQAALDCELVARDPAHTLPRGLFSGGATFTAATGRTVPLDRLRAPMGERSTERAMGCDALLVQADGLPDTLVFWSGLDASSVPVEPLDQMLPGRVDLVEDGGALALAASSPTDPIQIAALETHAAESCDAPVAEALAWSETFPTGAVDVAAMDVGPDGCMAIDVVDVLGDGRRVFVCAPSWALPLSVGDRVTFETTRTDLAADPLAAPRSSLRVVRHAGDAATGDTTARLEVVFYDGIGVDLRDLAGVASIAERSECSGARTTCDAFTIPAALTIGAATVLPGDIVDVTAVDRRTGSLYLGRAEHVAVAPPTCDAARTAVGAHVNLLVLYDEGL